MADSARIEELKRRVLLDPASIAFAALAEEYRRGGRFEDAIATCQAGLQRHPAYLSARVTLGRALLELGRYDEARTELELVLRSAPENLAAIRGLAEIHHRVGDLPETVPVEPRAAGTPIAPPPVAPPAPAPAPVAPVPDPPAAVAPRAATPPVTAPPPTTPPPATPAPVAAAHVAPAHVAPLPVAPAPPAPPVSRAPVVPGPALSRFEAPAPVALPPHPRHRDEEALPALEAFLTAITAARSSAR
jgi:tetratricopeptide (TPR) repeat protein